MKDNLVSVLLLTCVYFTQIKGRRTREKKKREWGTAYDPSSVYFKKQLYEKLGHR